ncbi:hypothetical protein BU085_12305 [Staphylococcus warneri]|uniref:Delta-hemolysin n=1 Tax=Staphylococcus warneri TaxID=1292 RepID=A0A2T4PXE8_STAWA|nr:hypothetical protein BU085_12305 [Staphylococcus warneri]
MAADLISTIGDLVK